MRRLRGATLAILAAGLLLTGPAPARATEPLFSFAAPDVIPVGTVPRDFRDPCGLAVDGTGRLYLSDYYHDAFDVFQGNGLPTSGFLLQRAGIDSLDGPCGLAVDASGAVYVNDYHRQVLRYAPSSFPPTFATTYGTPTTVDIAHPTGVAVDRGSGRVFVDERTQVAAYDSSGAPVAPFQIGAGGIDDGYGVAVSAFPATAGRVYVPDAADGVVEVYDPALDPIHPAATISGPPGGFSSLVDSAIAIDDQTGEVYVTDRVGSRLAESPEAMVYVFDHEGAYEGRLKYSVVDGSPVGLAVDNSAAATQGRVYVTSGNTVGARVYAYPPGAAGSAAAPAYAAQSGLPESPSSAADRPESRGAGSGPSSAAASPSGQIGRRAEPKHRRGHRRHRRHGHRGRLSNRGPYLDGYERVPIQ